MTTPEQIALVRQALALPLKDTQSRMPESADAFRRMQKALHLLAEEVRDFLDEKLDFRDEDTLEAMLEGSHEPRI